MSGHTEVVPHNGDGWPTAVASLMVGACFFALWFWLLPSWLGFRMSAPGWRWMAVVPSILGFSAAARCVWDFGWIGHGTPAPFVPPSRLVVVGLYRYVRNPMYVGFISGWTGLWITLGRANVAMIAAAMAIVVAVALFVRVYEEPTLRRMFGAEYETYCRNVRRWIPRLRAWRQ